MAPDDLRAFPLPDLRPLTADLDGDTMFALEPAAVTPLPEERSEPSFDLGPVMIGFDEPEPAEAENEPSRLDPDTVQAEPEARAPRSTEWRRSWAVDLGAAGVVHIVTLLLLLPWPLMPTEVARPIPVQLVLEQPPPRPEPEPPPKPETRPPPGRLASTSLGDPAAKPAKPAPDSTRPELVSALPRPAPLPEPELTLAEPVLKPAAANRAARAKPLKHEAAARSAPHPPADPAWGRVPGPTATEDEYLAYANALIRRNQELIPAALLRGRNGIAVISILVLADGTIAHIEIKESSGYPDIDERAERMVAAVKRFPPLPQWFKGDTMLLSYHMLFGDRMVLP